MTKKKSIKFGVIGCGLMGKEFASAVSRWLHLIDHPAKPEIVAVCDQNEEAMCWFEDNLTTITFKTTNYKELLQISEIDAIYCAVPHFLHKEIYSDVIKAGKHLLGEKPFGIDLEDHLEILKIAHQHPNVLVRCSSEFPFYPGAFQVYELIQTGFLGQIIDAECGFWHSSDLDPNKKINWKRKQSTNGEYGCMGDLGMHSVHLPLRLGWQPTTVYAYLTNLITERPDSNNESVPCDTWDNALLITEARTGEETFPLSFSFKRIAPGHANTWFLKINGSKGSIEYSTKYPKQLKTLSYSSGGKQAWETVDLSYKCAYSTLTGSIFEFGFSDSILQMWAAFCEELISPESMSQPFYCATLEEAHFSHKLFTAALKSYKEKAVITL